MQGGMHGGTGWDFRTRTEADAELFLKERERRRGPRASRRERLLALVALVLVLAVWGLWSFLAG